MITRDELIKMGLIDLEQERKEDDRLERELRKINAAPVWEQLENNQSFIQQKMQGKRRVY